jgi:chromate reductase
MRVLAIAGSLRADSHNARLLREAARVAPAGTEVIVWPGLREVPPYDADMDVTPAPEAVAAMRDAIWEADALLIATPEYNASIPGVLKNAIDWASRPWPDNPLRGKPTTVLSASEGSFGAVWAQAELKKVLGIAGARVMDEGLALPRAHEAFDPDGRLVEPVYRESLAATLEALVDQVRERAIASAA